MIRIIFVCLILFSCGREHCNIQTPAPAPLPAPAPVPKPDPVDPGGRPSYQRVASLLNTYCAQCHASATFMTNESSLRASAVKNQLYSKRMPPANAAKVLPENVRAEVLLFF